MNRAVPVHERAARVRAMFLRALVTRQELGDPVPPEDIVMGDDECEPFFSSPLHDSTVVLEGDYARGVLRVRDLDGRTLVEVNAMAPAPLVVEALLSWTRAATWAPPAMDDDKPAFETTVPAPLSGLLLRVMTGATLLASMLEPAGALLGA